MTLPDISSILIRPKSVTTPLDIGPIVDDPNHPVMRAAAMLLAQAERAGIQVDVRFSLSPEARKLLRTAARRAARKAKR